MLLISGRFGLILVLTSVFLAQGRKLFSPLASLPIEAVQIAALLAVYGAASITAALIARSLSWMRQTIGQMSDDELR